MRVLFQGRQIVAVEAPLPRPASWRASGTSFHLIDLILTLYRVSPIILNEHRIQCASATTISEAPLSQRFKQRPRGAWHGKLGQDKLVNDYKVLVEGNRTKFRDAFQDITPARSLLPRLVAKMSRASCTAMRTNLSGL